MAFIEYRSDDASAPVVTGEAGKTNDLLQAVLVDGYGALPPAGWTMPYTDAGSETAVFRQGSGAGHYFQVVDAGGRSGGYRGADLRGYESMSAYNTGSNGYPSGSQQSGAPCCIRKSFTEDSTPRAWRIFADDQTAYVFIMTGETSNPTKFWGYCLGSIYSYAPGDSYNSCIIAGSNVCFTSSQIFNSYDKAPADELLVNISNVQEGHYLARGFAGTGVSTQFGKRGNAGLVTTSGGTTYMQGLLAFPNGSDGGLYMSPIYLNEGGGPYHIRGELRGLYHICHEPGAFGDGDTFQGIGALTGREFKIIKPSPGGGMWCVETSDTLNTN